MRGRQFSNRQAPVEQSREWSETPAQREQRLAAEAPGKVEAGGNQGCVGGGGGDDGGSGGGDSIRPAADRAQEAQLHSLVNQLRQSRGASLYEEHQRKLQERFLAKHTEQARERKRARKESRRRERERKRERRRGGTGAGVGAAGQPVAADHSLRRGGGGTTFSWDRERDIEHAGSKVSLKQSQQMVAKAAQLGSKFSHATTERNFL